MKVIITSNYAIGNETGSSKVAELLVEYLSKNNQVVFICLGNKYGEYKVSKNLTRIEIPLIDFRTFQFPLITPLTMYKVFKFLDNFKPDVIHAQNAILVSKMAEFWSIINNVPFIITYHHIPTEAIYHILPALEKSVLGSLVQEIYKETTLKNTLKNTAGIIAVNNAISDSIRTVDKNIKIGIINNGIETKVIKKTKFKKLDKNNVHLVFLGSYNERKNQLFLLKTFKYLPNYYKLELYGNFSSGGEYLQKLKSYIDKHSLNNVVLRDFTKDVSKVFNRTNFLISASKKEAQSLVVIQSIVAGKPVIGIENETISELINKNNGLVVKRGISAKKFADKIQGFVNTCDYPQLCKNIKNDSFKFGMDIVTSKIEDFYKTICNSYSKNSRGNIGDYYNKILQKISVIKK